MTGLVRPYWDGDTGLAGAYWKLEGLPTISGAELSTLPATELKRRLVEERRQRVWQMWCQGVPVSAIAKQLGMSEPSIKNDVRKIRDRHPAQELAGDETGRFVEAYELLREAGLLLRTEIAAAKANGDDVRPLLSTLSIHADRHSRFLTRQQAIPVVEVSNTFDTSLWSSLLGANAGQPMESAAVVEALPGGDGNTHTAAAEPSPEQA